MNIDYPFHIDGLGRTATTSDDDHIRDMIEQFLFTSPFERVNRPDFGAGLLRLPFEPNSPELATALEHTIRAAGEGIVEAIYYEPGDTVEADAQLVKIRSTN